MRGTEYSDYGKVTKEGFIPALFTKSFMIVFYKLFHAKFRHCCMDYYGEIKHDGDVVEAHLINKAGIVKKKFLVSINHSLIMKELCLNLSDVQCSIQSISFLAQNVSQKVLLRLEIQNPLFFASQFLNCMWDGRFIIVEFVYGFKERPVRSGLKRQKGRKGDQK